MRTEYCEACERAPIATIVADDDPAEPYRLCRACAIRLQARALRPLEWFNLAARHGWTKYLLHDDFYDQDGRASQPDSDDVDSDGRSAPSLDEASRTLPRLIDFCVTRWHIDSDTVACFHAFPPAQVAAEIERRVADGNPHVFAVMLEIAARTLGAEAAKWVREQYDRACRDKELWSWCRAAAACLPTDEGLRLAFAALDRLEERPMREAKAVLVWFRSATVLDWIEQHVPPATISDSGGLLAACSDLDLPRIEGWITAGRPLSLVAIDALMNLIPSPGQAPLLGDLEPRLERCSDRVRIQAALERALAADDSPRVSTRVESIIGRIDRIRIAA